jgi:hypothetical protein
MNELDGIVRQGAPLHLVKLNMEYLIPFTTDQLMESKPHFIQVLIVSILHYNSCWINHLHILEKK